MSRWWTSFIALTMLALVGLLSETAFANPHVHAMPSAPSSPTASRQTAPSPPAAIVGATMLGLDAEGCAAPCHDADDRGDRCACTASCVAFLPVQPLQPTRTSARCSNPITAHRLLTGLDSVPPLPPPRA